MSTTAVAAGSIFTRRAAPTIAALVGLAGFGWAVTLRSAGMEDEMMLDPTAAAAFLLAWVAMMAAMMIPSAAPFVLLYAGGAKRRWPTVLLVLGYLGVWAAFSATAYVAQLAVDRTGMGDGRAYAVAATLGAAGMYQLTPLKSACLRRCRSPLAFLMERWRGGRLGALRIGAEHGLFCLGCCWALMVVLVVAGAMSLVWVVAIALAVLVEKLLPHGERWARVGGLALIALGVAVAADPDLAMSLAT